MEWKTKWRWNTGYSADSVEWCPVDSYRELLVCGTYQLHKSNEKDQQTTKQERLGKIHVFTISKNAGHTICPSQTIDTSGILDMKWCYHTVQGCVLLAAVTSAGYLELYRVVNNDGIQSLEFWQRESIGEDRLALSVDWSTNKTHSGEPALVISDSSGFVTLMELAQCNLHKIGIWKAHSFEAWTTAFNYFNTDLFYSGGDDCIFKSYDARVSDSPVATVRSHEAGVTAIRSHTQLEHQLLTGSYDEKVRLWDARSLKRNVSETVVNGGVWRLKWHPSEPSVVLVACMYGGFRTLRLAEQDMTITSEYLEHESIAYGADWSFKTSCDASLVATCSFYDCKMHIAEITAI